MVEEQQERCAKIAALLTESCPREARFLAQRATTRAAAPDNIKRLHAAGYTNVTQGTLSIAPALLMARMKKPECVDQLRLWLECGGSVDAQQRGGGDWQMGGNGGLLCQAIHVHNADAAALLIRRGANTEGALHQLCSLKDFPRAVEIARLLVDAGEDVNAVRHGRQRLPWGDMRPLRDAVFNGYDDVVHLLLSRGAKTDWYEQLWRSRSVDGAVLLTNSNKLIAVVLAAGGWRKYTLPPRKDMLVLRELCEKDRAKPSAQCERLFALPKGVFWHVISFWRSHLDEPHAIDDEEYTAALTKQPTAQEYNYHRVARVMPGMNLDAAGAEAFRQQLLALNLIPADAALPAPREQPARDAVAGRVVLAARVNGETFELPNPPTAALRPGDALSLVPEIVHEGEALDAARRRPGIIEGTVSTSVATAGVAAEVTAAEETAETPIGRATRLRREARRRAREQR